MNTSLLLLSAAGAAQAQGETPCQKCCAPGGDCSKAYKGTAGKCCGVVEGQAFCCPGVTFRGPNSGDAKCYNCGSTYRCYTGLSARNVCGNSGGGGAGWARVAPTRMHRESSHADSSSMFIMLLLGGLIVFAVLNCARRQEVAYGYPPKPVAYGVPAGQGPPVMGGPMGYGGGGYGYGGGGYGAGSVAAGAAAGFVGGMLVNEAMSHHHDGGYGGHYGGGDYGGGGGDYGGGGGDFGGGDSGFSADS